MLRMSAHGERNGEPVQLIVLGLSHKNLDKLREGMPIKFNGATVGLGNDVEVLIFAGPDERTMQHDFAQFIGPNTEVYIDPKLRD